MRQKISKAMLPWASMLMVVVFATGEASLSSSLKLSSEFHFLFFPFFFRASNNFSSFLIPSKILPLLENCVLWRNNANFTDLYYQGCTSKSCLNC